MSTSNPVSADGGIHYNTSYLECLASKIRNVAVQTIENVNFFGVRFFSSSSEKKESTILEGYFFIIAFHSMVF